jgi:hypothetical protein
MAVFRENKGDFKKTLGIEKNDRTMEDSLNDQNKVCAEVEKKFAVKQKQKE